jgi:hypothetical protein
LQGNTCALYSVGVLLFFYPPLFSPPVYFFSIKEALINNYPVIPQAGMTTHQSFLNNSNQSPTNPNRPSQMGAETARAGFIPA